jgi:hypothetical protein
MNACTYAPLATVMAPNGDPWIFALDSDGQLRHAGYKSVTLNQPLKPTILQWFCKMIGTPPGIVRFTEKAVHCAVTAPWSYIGVFVVDEGKLWECASKDGDNWSWYPHEGGGNLSGLCAYPSAIYAGKPNDYLAVFCQSDDCLVERYFIRGVGWSWGFRQNFGSDLLPFVSVATEWGYRGIFISRANGWDFREWYYDSDLGKWQAGIDHPNPGFYGSMSAVTSFKSKYLGIFGKRSDGVDEYYFKNGWGHPVRNHPHPEITLKNVGLHTGPSAVYAPWGYLGVFVIGDDDKTLYELASGDDGDTWGEWYAHPPVPADSPIYRPVSLLVHSNSLRVFLITTNQVWFERLFMVDAGWGDWINHGIDGGQLT